MIFTFGHSTMDEDAGAHVLRSADIDILIDIRSHPASRWEAWRIENLRDWVPKAGMGYEWWPSLGGWRTDHYEQYATEMLEHEVDLAAYSKGKFPKQRIAPNRGVPDGTSWTNQGLWDYQWFQTIKEYNEGVDKLIQMYSMSDTNVAIMCCEVLWWKCHRSMVADNLWYRGVQVAHLQPKYTPHPGASRIARYHPDVIAAWRR